MKNKIIFFYTLLALKITIVVGVAIISIPNNLILNYYNLNPRIGNAILPQGWAFFTNDPREFKLYVYKIDNQKISKIDLKNFTLKQYLGLKKSNRIVHHAIQKNIENIPSSHWYTFKGDLCKLNLNKINSYFIKEGEQYLNDNYLICLKKITPWYWFSKNKKTQMQGQYIILNKKQYVNYSSL